MARQRHLKISCDRLTATLVTPAVCQTSACQENKFGRFLPTSVACAKHASFAFTSTAGVTFQLCHERVDSEPLFFGQSEPGDVKTNGLGGARQQFRTALGNGTLTIKGEKKQETEEKKENYYTSERRCGAFERSFQVPQDVDERRIEASFSRAC